MEMLKMLPPNRFDEIVGTNLICRITLEHVPGSYDHKRYHAVRRCMTRVPFPAGAFPVWDFHVLTSDGKVHRFHPRYSKKLAATAKVEGVPIGLPTPPDAGRGLSDGPGTYRRIINGNYDVVESTQSTVVEAIDDTADPGTRDPSTLASTCSNASPNPGEEFVFKAAARDESTVVEQGKERKGDEKATACNTGAAADGMAEAPWPEDSTDKHKANADGVGSWTPTASSSSDWKQGWQSRWQSGWVEDWKTGWRS